MFPVFLFFFFFFFLKKFDHKQYVEADKQQLRSRVSRHNFFHENQHLMSVFQNPVGNTTSKYFPGTSVEIVSFRSDFNARDVLNSKRRLVLSRGHNRN